MTLYKRLYSMFYLKEIGTIYLTDEEKSWLKANVL